MQRTAAAGLRTYHNVLNRLRGIHAFAASLDGEGGRGYGHEPNSPPGARYPIGGERKWDENAADGAHGRVS